MRKRKKLIILVLGSLIVLSCLGTITVFAYQQVYKTGTIKWYQNMIKIEDSQISNMVQQVTCGDNQCSIYDMNYQKAISKKINQLLKKNSYTFENSLMIYNAYGTNTTSINIYFNSDEKAELSYRIHVANQSIPDYENTLYIEDEYTKEH